MAQDPKAVIQELYFDLSAGRDQGNLSKQGESVLNAIETGVVTPQSIGQYLQGATLNFSDELVGTLNSVFGKKPGVISKAAKEAGYGEISPREAGVGLERLALEQRASEKPLRSIGEQVVGGAIPFIASKGLTLPLSLPKAAIQGLKTGAIGGFGAGEGGAEQQLTSTAIGGAAGAVAAPALQFGARIAKQSIQPLVKSMFAEPDVTGLRAGRNLVKEALKSDVGSVDEAINLVLQNSGKPYTLADIGPNTRAYLDAVSLIPSPAKQTAKKFLEQRDKGLSARLTSDLQSAFGTTASFFDEFNALKTARTDLGKKMYANAFKKQVPVNRELTDLLGRPSMQQAYTRGIDIAQEKGIKVPNVSVNAQGQLVTADNKLVPAVDTEFLHFVKMGLDDLVYTGKTPTSGIGSTQLNSIKDTRAKFLNYIDKNNSSYKSARNYWADDTATMDAMQEGRKFLKANPDQLKADIKNMSTSEKEAFRLGAMSDLIERVGGQSTDTVVPMTANVARNILKDPKRVALIKATFPDNELGKTKFNQFIKNFQTEMEMKATSGQVLAGSQTASRQEAAKSIRGTIAQESPNVNDVQSLIFNALKMDATEMNEQQLKSTAKEVVNILTETDPARLQQIALELTKRRPMEVVSDVLTRGGRGLISPYTTGGIAGKFGSTTQQRYFPSILGTPNK
jgi:hypothetical protein